MQFPIWTGRTSPYRPWLPSPLLGEPEWFIEQYVYQKMVESGGYNWVACQWAISPQDRPDIVARTDGPQGPFFTVIEVKAGPLRDRHFRQLERYVARLGEMVGHRNLVGYVISPDCPMDQPVHGNGRTFWAPPEWLALDRTLDAMEAAGA